MTESQRSSDTRQELDRILQTRGVRTLYQPIVDLQTRRTVGYEALARGPSGSILESAPALFDAARAEGRLFELDWAARLAAVEGAQAAGYPPSLRLFVNVEPGSLTRPTDPETINRALSAISNLSVVAEFTERALVSRPGDLMDAVEWLRQAGMGVAVDDVGADVGSLALMPFIRPDVIKLDMRIIQHRPSRDVVAVANAVQAEAELHGTTILAEGIETEAHRVRAVAMGARVGQGWLFGRPGALPDLAGAASDVLPLLQRPLRAVDATPFGVAQRALPLRTGDKALLATVSHYLEEQARDMAGVPVVLACFQTASRFWPVRQRYEALPTCAPLVGLFAVDLPRDLPAPFRVACLSPEVVPVPVGFEVAVPRLRPAVW